MDLTAQSAGPPAALPDPVPAWQQLLGAMLEPAWLFDGASGAVLAVNDAACRLLERPRDEILGSPAAGMVLALEDQAWWAGLDATERQPLHSEVTLLTRAGRSIPVMRSIAFVNGGRHGLVCVRDCSAVREAEEQREAHLAELRATLEATADGILVTDLDGHLRACNHRLGEIWGMPPEPVQAHDHSTIATWMCRAVVDTETYQRRLDALHQSPLMHSTDRLVLRNGRIIERVSRPLWSRGRVLGRVYSFRDLTESLQADQRLAQMSTTDALTGLPNRRLLAERVSAAAGRSRRSGRSFALLVIDLDHFRDVNDTLGHDTGDRVIVDMVRRIKGCMRGDDQLARIGGDQFAMIIDAADDSAAEAMARRVLALVAQPCELEGVQFTLTCSIGMALFRGELASLDSLISQAETAMRQVKDSGRANYRLHQARGSGDPRRKIALDHAMRQALVSGRFRLHYQPQVELGSGRLVGAEALIRWRDPELGDVSPAQFIPVAEDTGFIIAIGDWVLSQAVRQASVWHERGMPVPVAVNVSALQFQQAQFVDRVASVLAVSGLPPALLELELTESILVRDAEDALQRLKALSRLGVRLSIDDFGTGYSSLAYLKRFPIDKLKIDRSFVKGLPNDDSDAGIVRAILQMARVLNMKVVAEGVETETQRQFLLDEGCEMFQGFLFAPALDSLSFERRVLAARESDPTPRVRLVRG